MGDVDYATWFTKEQAAERIGATTKTVERFVQAGKIQQARWRRPTGGPELAVYCPEDVDRIAAERHPGPLPAFLVPATKKRPANGNGGPPRDPLEALAIAPVTVESGNDLLRALVAALVQSMSQTSQTCALFLTLAEASAVSGLSQAYLKRKCADGTLKAIRDRGWRIRRTDLEAL
jgi:hypothetical protein